MGLFGSAPKAPKPQLMGYQQKTAQQAGGLSAWAMKNRRLTPYAGDWTADLTGGQNAAIDAITQRGMQGNPLLGEAQGYASDVLSGKYLGEGNPYLAQAMAAARDDLGREIGGAFSTGGMAGSPMHQQFLTEAWSKATAPLLFQNYENERANQMAMAGMSPELANADFVGLNQALGAQSVRQQQAQAEADALRQQHDLQQSEPYRRASAAMSALGGMAAPTLQGGDPGQKGLVPGMLQGAMGGGMAGLATGNPWAAGGGAILGGLGGGAANK